MLITPIENVNVDRFFCCIAFMARGLFLCHIFACSMQI
jgi:hypothetical protein